MDDQPVLTADQETLDDFLIEVTEITEALSGQLVALEQRPGDRELLNAIFRAFHTIKGDAGFIGADPLVALCHSAEEVFNRLRNGALDINAELMDVVLTVVDQINEMLAQVRNGRMPTPAPAALFGKLAAACVPDPSATLTEAVAEQDDETNDPGDVALTGLRADEPAPGQEARRRTDEADDLLDAMLDGPSPGKLMDPDQAQNGSDGHGEVINELSSAPAGEPSSGQGTQPQTDQTDDILDAMLSAPWSGTVTVPRQAPDSGGGDAGVPNEFFSASTEVSHASEVSPRGGRSVVEHNVRIDTRNLDEIMNLVGELVLVRNRIANRRELVADEELARIAANLDLVTTNLQEAVMRTRMQPVGKLFNRFPRVVRDLARQLGKEVSLSLAGEDTGLDKNLVEALADPLVHLVRNAVDHGIEMPEDRARAGKPRSGQLRLAAYQEGDVIVIVIADDGAGMDPAGLRRSAVDKGILSAEAAARLDDQASLELIFAPGFSTRSQITDVSGRGVGMDVVKDRIGQLNGHIQIESKLGEGTRMFIRVPLTLAIVPTLMVRVMSRELAVPLSHIEEILKLSALTLHTVEGRRTAMVRQQALPLLSLRRWMGLAPAGPDADEHLLVVGIGSQRLGLVVDDVVGQEEVVIKPLGTLLHGLPGYAGATIAGDGHVALIVDVPGIIRTEDRQAEVQA